MTDNERIAAAVYWNDTQGLPLARQGRFTEAAACFREALRLHPDYPEAHSNLAGTLAEQGDLQAALRSYQDALRLRPDSAEAHHNLGVVFARSGDLGRAITSYQEAIRLQPDGAQAHFDLGVARLLLGNFKDGWPEFAWWKVRDKVPPFRQPPWRGAPLEGRTILLTGHGGFGDTIQFIRYAPQVRERGGKTIVACHAPLIPLLARNAGVDLFMTPGQGMMPHFDVHAPLNDLPAIFGTTLETIPATVPYLRADSELQKRWRRELDALPGFKVGIAWRGNPRNPQDAQRSVPLACFVSLARLPGVRLFSLQVGTGADELQNASFCMTDLGNRFDPSSFEDAAAAVTILDLVISADSAMAHLAGALAVPVWTVLPVYPDWRWLLEREDSPWYPTMRLFRQKRPGDWDNVLERLRDALAEIV
jgi:hypothetical protein